MDSLLKVQALEKYYGNEKGTIIKAIDDISFEVQTGEFVAIMGASGSGKTTLLNILAAIDSPSSGHIFLEKEDISNLSEKELALYRGKYLGFIFQDYNLLDTLTIYENIALSLTFQHIPVSVLQNKIIELAKKLDILGILEKYPYEVSGGERQRCACARAIIKSPKLILADEPTGALDSKASKILMETLVQINSDFSATILLVTHDAVTASYCHKVLFLQDGKIFNQILKGEKDRKYFFHEILDVLSIWGGGFCDVR